MVWPSIVVTVLLEEEVGIVIVNAVDQVELPLGITRVSPAAIKDAHALTSLSDALAAVKVVPFTPHPHQPTVVEKNGSTKNNVRRSRI